MHKGTSKWAKRQASRELENRCGEYLKPLREAWPQVLDRRWVKTWLDLVIGLLIHRNRNTG